MRVLGINYTQDASIALLNTDNGIIHGVRKERLSKKKHAWGAPDDFQKFYSRIEVLRQEPVDLIIESFSSDPIRRQRSELQDDLFGVLSRTSQSAEILEIAHHQAHLHSVLPASTAVRSAGLVVDCMGSPRVSADMMPVVSVMDDVYSSDPVEVSSLYTTGPAGSVDVVAKQFWDRDWSAPVGLGAFYFLLTRCFYNEEGCEGKVMALASYGEAERLSLPPLEVRNGFEVLIPQEWLDAFDQTGRFSFSTAGGPGLGDVFHPDRKVGDPVREPALFRSAVDFAAAGQSAFESGLATVVRFLLKETGARELLYAGGVALNCVANGKLQASFPEVDIQIPVAPDDGGTSIGAALWGAAQHGAKQSRFSSFQVSGFYGIDVPKEIADKPTDKRFRLENDAELVEYVASALSRGKIIAFCQAASEFGPRALGNRSLLADPRQVSSRERLNTIKGREWFRPVAPTVTWESASSFFEGDTESEYMQFARAVRREMAELIPAVVHSDGTARLQTLRRHENPLLYDIITEFEETTGIPMLVNTSFNPRGGTIVETLEEAENVWADMDVDILVVGSTVFLKPS